jgi:hypothetical protein
MFNEEAEEINMVERQFKNIAGKRYHLIGRYETKDKAEHEKEVVIRNHPHADLYKISARVTRETSHPRYYGKVHYAVWVHFPPERAKYFGALSVHSKKYRASGRK